MKNTKNHPAHSVITNITTLLAIIIFSFSFVSKSNAQECNKNKNNLTTLAASSKAIVDSLPPEHDHRKPLDRIENPEYNAIGIVKTKHSDGQNSRGSAFLISKCLVMTNKHVLEENKNHIGKKVTFLVGQTNATSKEPFKYTSKGTVVAHGNESLEYQDDFSEDWAIIKLDKPLGSEKHLGELVGFIEPLLTERADRDAGMKICESIEIAGFPGEKSLKDLWWQGNCEFLGADNTQFKVGCPVTKGNSGSPLLCRLADNKSLNVMGIASQKAGRIDASHSVNFEAQSEQIAAAYFKYKDSCD